MIGMHIQIALKNTDTWRQKKRTIEHTNKLQWTKLEKFQQMRTKKMPVNQSATTVKTFHAILAAYVSIVLNMVWPNTTTQQNITFIAHILKVCRRKLNGNKFINSTATRIIRHRYGDVSTATAATTNWLKYIDTKWH